MTKEGEVVNKALRDHVAEVLAEKYAQPWPDDQPVSERVDQGMVRHFTAADGSRAMAPVTPVEAATVAVDALAAGLDSRIGEMLRQAAEERIIAEWICCDPIDPHHQLCVQGAAALRMITSLTVGESAPLTAAVMSALAPERGA
ncbi:hypothetical protein [Streptomyces sp. 5-10]|uniref:hypothetical protein n=1 Tax=Streptomyces sp. 5-10 TaxID=878925 RepID=UPI00168A9C30|nr:hypothetical protein [Streptomyces sp. 5-10]MBD3004817.1 hypothetical protein [Streptomyces sp. 5-10]